MAERTGRWFGASSIKGLARCAAAGGLSSLTMLHVEPDATQVKREGVASSTKRYIPLPFCYEFLRVQLPGLLAITLLIIRDNAEY